MSAFVVDREHVVYLLAAAAEFNRGGTKFSWYWRKQWREFTTTGWDQPPRTLEVGTMLWEENIKSVLYRYDDCTRANMPGPCGEDFKLRKGDLLQHQCPEWSYAIDPVQVLSSCTRYEYQACEHPGWKRSQALAFIEALRAKAVRALPGYDAAEDWPGRRAKMLRARKAREAVEAGA